MKKMRQRVEKVLVLAVIITSIASTGCSQWNALLIVNESESSITVEYQFGIDPVTRGTAYERRAFEQPVVQNIAALRDCDTPPWPGTPSDRVAVDETRGHVRAVLAPGEAIRVRVVLNYSEGKTWDQAIVLESVEITAPTGSARYTGTQLEQRFIRDGRCYILSFS